MPQSETKWTPGPWRVGAEYRGEITDIVARVPEGMPCTGTQTIAIMRTDIEALTLEARGAEISANAHLIAAAPDLYAALEEMLKHGEHEGECDNGDGEFCACMLHLAPSEARAQKARAALAKARGEQFQ
jgi:hypothetical protein